MVGILRGTFAGVLKSASKKAREMARAKKALTSGKKLSPTTIQEYTSKAGLKSKKTPRTRKEINRQKRGETKSLKAYNIRVKDAEVKLVPFKKQSRIIASSHSFEYIGTGVDPTTSIPSRGAVPIQENEIDDRNGGITIFTSTDQTGNFRIGDGVVINQQDGTITGDAYNKSLFSTMTPFILAVGGD